MNAVNQTKVSSFKYARIGNLFYQPDAGANADAKTIFINVYKLSTERAFFADI